MGQWSAVTAAGGGALPVVGASQTLAPGPVVDAATVQVMAHSLIADLFDAGLRIQRIGARAPEELKEELDDVADHLDRVISELRSFAFQARH